MTEHVLASLNGAPALAARVVLRRGAEPSTCAITLPPGTELQAGDALTIELRDVATRRTLRQFICTRTQQSGDGRLIVHGADRRYEWADRRANLPATGGIALSDALARLFLSAGLSAQDAPTPAGVLPPLPPLNAPLVSLVQQLCAFAGESLTIDDDGEWQTRPAHEPADVNESTLVESHTERTAPAEVTVQGGPTLRLVTMRDDWQAVIPDATGELQPLSALLQQWGIAERDARRACLTEGGFRGLVGTAPDAAARDALLRRFAFRMFRAAHAGWIPVGGVAEDGALLPPRLEVGASRATGVAPAHPADNVFEAETWLPALDAFELDLERGLLLLHEPPYLLEAADDPTRQSRRLVGEPRIALTIALPTDAPPFRHTRRLGGDGPARVIDAPHLFTVLDEHGASLNANSLAAQARSLTDGMAHAPPRVTQLLVGIAGASAAGCVASVTCEAGPRGLLTTIVQEPALPGPLPRALMPAHRIGAVKPELPLHQPLNAYRAGPLVVKTSGNAPEGESVIASEATSIDPRTGAISLEHPGTFAFPYFLASDDAARFGRWFFVAGCESTAQGRVRVLGPDDRHAELAPAEFGGVRKMRPEGLRGLLVSLSGEPEFVDAGPLVSDARGATRGDASNLVADLDGSSLSAHKRGGLQFLTVLALSPAHRKAGVGGGAPGWVPVLNLRDGATGNHAASGRGLFAEGAGRDLGRLAATGNGGPVLADSAHCSKHLYGSAAGDDGVYRESAGHLSTEAFFKVPRDPAHDAPLTFYAEPFAGAVPPWPPYEAQIKYHEGSTHHWDGKTRPGRWKIQYRVPFLPEIPPTWKPPTKPPVDDPPIDDPPRVVVPVSVTAPDDVRGVVSEHELWAPSHDWVPAPSDRQDEREVPFPGPSIKSEGWAGEVNGVPDCALGGGCIFLPPLRSLNAAGSDGGTRNTWLLLHPEVSLAFGSPGMVGAAGVLQGWVMQLATSGHHLLLAALDEEGASVDDNSRGLHVTGHMQLGRPDATYGADAALRLGEDEADGIAFGDDTILHRADEGGLATPGDFSIGGKLTVAGLIDPTGLTLDPQAANPGGPSTLWEDSGAGALMYGAARLAMLAEITAVRVIEWTGNGASGLAVTLTGVNRAHAIVVMRTDSAATTQLAFIFPAGATGTQLRRTGDGSAAGDVSFGTQSAGTSQVLTLNTTDGSVNADGATYRAIVVGTPT
ncbi:MAG: hypothetical protein IPK87_14605 [Planctomycetes bacterium]|nr:hypothetical protein [Planctomycetota bacterium]